MDILYLNNDKMYNARHNMVVKLEQRGISSGSVLNAMMRVPRHCFVSEALCYRAYDDTSLPIGFGQTISTPSVVASMVQSLRLTGDESVLDIGSGSGYQTAVLAELAGSVTAMERIPELAERSRIVLKDLGYLVRVINSDNFNEIEGSFDRIIVAAGVKIFPSELLSKVNEGGVLVIPVDESGKNHQIKRIVKKRDDDYFEEIIGRATFVPYIIGERMM
ncbi:MAG TPA: protein-L-isoaspartate(D-aspartate) O-methyltransferase [Spirochaetota bacterium]|nr:protein-L-isoaspartate(D-aspartate) O-methyltransferase [Spirochaetota bacterium]HPF06871.1 protein-L-isoaspartate(D-aspartate) O-methyltransferase [Spirochaetota bacterium]HPJ43454.1 protein-L-isoaspartate(D-aspartate) O-methyltransferase [Spirochaetota bacterium]HPR36138.1 protein-L-isoaspartate(D-aspartate) O-methyltransferase [Spirochaetota bacterium]